MRFRGLRKVFRMEMVSALFLALFLALLFGVTSRQSWSQETSVPSLHHRSGAEPGATEDDQDNSAQQSTLPGDVSGPYNFDHFNESIEIDITHNNKLAGYITRMGDAETDDNTALTYFFDRSSIDGSEITFQTRVVHGIWYSFRGTIFRGDAKTRDEEGYYVLHGVLATHHPQSGFDKSANETIERRTVNYKSMQQ